MSVRRYGKLLRLPGFPYLMGTSIMARLPLGMTGLALVLLVSQGGHYARSGAVVAVYVAGAGIAGPVLGRAVDRVGRTEVLRAAALAEAALLTALALVPSHALFVVFACAFGAGLCSPPVVSSTRSLWPVVVPAEQLQDVYALEATLQELAFIIGPSLVAVTVVVADARVAVVLSAVVLAIGVFAFSFHPLTRGVGPTSASRSRRRAFPLPLVVIGAGLVLVGSFNFVELSTVAFTRAHGAAADAGLVLAVWSAGSLVGGLLFGARAANPAAPARRLAGLLLVLAVGTVLPAAAPGVVVLGGLLFVGGLAIAPTFAALYTYAATQSPPDRQTEAFGWLSSGFQVGSGIGALCAGLIIQSAGPHIGFVAAGAAVLLGATAMAVSYRRNNNPIGSALAGDPGVGVVDEGGDVVG